MATFHKGGGGTGRNALATLHLVDQNRLLMELWAKRIKCEIPDCVEQAIAIMNTGLAPLVCLLHRDAFLSSNKAARALNASVRRWLQYHSADIARYAYEGQDDESDVILVVDTLGRAETLLEQATGLARAASSFIDMQHRIEAAATHAVIPVQVMVTTPAPKVRPPVSSLPQANSHDGLQLFPA